MEEDGLKILDLFSGIGGIALGMEMAGFPPPVAFCEIEPFCRQVLAKHWPEVPCHEDIRGLSGESFPGGIDIITAGFPCQPFSRAARGRNNAEDLLPECLRVVEKLRPRWVLLENVSRYPIEVSALALDWLGYSVSGLEIGAEHIGAPHPRMRRWLVANSDENGKSICAFNAKMALLPKMASYIPWPNPPRGLGVAHGISGRVDRIAAIGNSVVPQVVAVIARAMLEADRV